MARRLPGTIAYCITGALRQIGGIDAGRLPGPHGWTYSSNVEDKEALAKVKVGDKVEITWTEAVLVSVEPGK